jgi:Asp-tRNA(Asn)/Glu-tRNA(Gln) amidotransferase A subunit family amidase
MPDPRRVAERLAEALAAGAQGLPRPSEELRDLAASLEGSPYTRGSRLARLLALEAEARRSALRDALASACGPGLSARILLECAEPDQGEALGAPGPLGYVPVVIKDNMDHPRFMTRLGAPYALHRPARMDPLTEKLVGAGAAVIGKASMHELALGTTNVNPHYGTPENPACPGRIPGGSSGGSAAAVAAGIAPLATGNDAGGSVRLPSAFTGTYGFKPSASGGLLPEAGKPPIPLLAAPGIIAATPLDAALALEGLAPGFGRAVLTLAASMAAAGESPGLRVVVPLWALERSEEPVASAFREAVEALRAGGWRVETRELTLPEPAEQARVVATIAPVLSSLLGLYRSSRGSMGDDVGFLLDIAANLPPWAYARAVEVLEAARAALVPKLRSYDAILTPTAPVEPPRITEADWRLSASTRLIEFTAPFNTLDLPAASVPASPRLPCGVPLGLQVSSAHGDLYTLAVSLEAWRILRGEGVE